MTLQAESGHEELREREKMLPEVEPEAKKPRKKDPRLQEPLYLSLIVSLS